MLDIETAAPTTHAVVAFFLSMAGTLALVHAGGEEALTVFIIAGFMVFAGANLRAIAYPDEDGLILANDAQEADEDDPAPPS